MTIIAYTEKELQNRGLIRNPHMWLGAGLFWCIICKAYTYHFAMSHRNDSDCFEVCTECKSYSGYKEVK